MNKLKCYLIGSIQDEADGGVSWRDKLSKFLLENGIEVSDPTKDECNHSVAPTIEEQKKKLENWKRGGEWGSFKQTGVVKTVLVQKNLCSIPKKCPAYKVVLV